MGTAKRERQKANRQARLEELARQARKQKTKRIGLRWGLGIPAAILLVFGLVYLFKDDTTSTSSSASTPLSTEATTPGTTPAPAPCPKPDGSSTRPASFPRSGLAMCIDPTHTYAATFQTSEGSFTVALNAAKQPITVNNFVGLARYHVYDGTKIFRADSGIDIIQGGATSPSDRFDYTIPDEGSGFTYTEGDLAMARTQLPNSAGLQWFIAGGPKVSALDAQGTYVTFGKVTSGLDVVKKILSYAGDGQTTLITKEVTITAVSVAETPAPTAGSAPGSTPAGSAPTGTSATGSTTAATTGSTTASGTKP